MAKIQANDLVLQLSVDGTTYKQLICEIGNKLSKTRQTTQTATKCDSGTVAIGLGAKQATVDFSAVADTAPTTGQCSFKDVDGWYEAGTYLYWKLADPSDGSNIYQQGRCYVTKMELDSQTQNAVQFNGTLSVDGAIDIAP